MNSTADLIAAWCVTTSVEIKQLNLKTFWKWKLIASNQLAPHLMLAAMQQPSLVALPVPPAKKADATGAWNISARGADIDSHTSRHCPCSTHGLSLAIADFRLLIGASAVAMSNHPLWLQSILLLQWKRCYLSAAAVAQPQAAHWHLSSWLSDPSPSPAAASRSELRPVSCASCLVPGSGKYEGLLCKGLGLSGNKYEIAIFFVASIHVP